MADEKKVDPQSGSGAGLIAFLNWAIDTHEIVSGTGVSLRTGCQKVLDSVDDPDQVDVRSGDIDGLIHRFRNKYRGSGMKEDTVDAYEKRFRQSVDMYRKWLDGEPWRPLRRRTQRSSTSTDKTSKRTASKVSAPPEKPIDHEPNAKRGGPEMITYPFPVRPGVQAKVILPEDLSSREAQRVAAFVATLAFDESSTGPPMEG